MAFWSIVLPGKGKEVEQEVESSETVLSSIHVTGLALGATPGKGPHVVSIEYNGTHTVLATLEAPHTRQFRLDIALDQTFKITNHGDSAVYAYGYQVATSNHIEDMSADEEDEDEEDDEFDMDEGEDEDEDEDEEEDDERPPKAVPLANGGKGKQLRAQRRDADDEEEEDEEDEEDDGIPDFKDLNSDDLVAENQGEDEDEDEGGEDDEEEDEEDEDEQMDEPEERQPAKVGGKRPAPAQTPQPAKALRGALRAEPKSAPPKQQAGAPRQIPVTTPAAAQKGAKEAKGAATPGNEAEFRQALVAMLKNAKNPVPLAVLGSAVQRPSAMKGRDFKLGSYLEKNSELFEYDSKKGLVSLKKGSGGKK